VSPLQASKSIALKIILPVYINSSSEMYTTKIISPAMGSLTPPVEQEVQSILIQKIPTLIKFASRPNFELTTLLNWQLFGD